MIIIEINLKGRSAYYNLNRKKRIDTFVSIIGLLSLKDFHTNRKLNLKKSQ